MNTAHLNTKITHLSDLPGRIICDCGRRACYTLPTIIHLSCRKQTQPIKTELRLCGKCLALEMQARRRAPLSSDID